EPFVVLLGDTIYTSNTSETTTSQLISAYEKEKKEIVMIEKVPSNKVKDYGIIAGKRISKSLWRIDDVIEKPDPVNAPSDMGITGTYLLYPEIYDNIKELKPGRNGEYQLSDALKITAERHGLLGYEISGERYDIGTKELWVKTFIDFARKDPRFSDLFS
ncbi:MAG: sugar phosphate nucleotidyltransferase, partial [Thermoplasmatales archaeon]